MSMKMIIYPLLGLGYGVILGLLGFLCGGFGHGSFIPLLIFAGFGSLFGRVLGYLGSIYPVDFIIFIINAISIFVLLAAPFLWAFIFFCLALMKQIRWRFVFVLLMLLQYASMLLIYLYSEDYQRLQFWQKYYEDLSFYRFTFIVFILGQLMIWGIFIYEIILLHLKKKHEPIK